MAGNITRPGRMTLRSEHCVRQSVRPSVRPSVRRLTTMTARSSVPAAASLSVWITEASVNARPFTSQSVEQLHFGRLPLNTGRPAAGEATHDSVVAHSFGALPPSPRVAWCPCADLFPHVESIYTRRTSTTAGDSAAITRWMAGVIYSATVQSMLLLLPLRLRVMKCRHRRRSIQ